MKYKNYPCKTCSLRTWRAARRGTGTGTVGVELGELLGVELGPEKTERTETAAGGLNGKDGKNVTPLH